MNIRRFSAADTNACRAIFQSNVPRYFLPEEEAGFLAFLAQLPGPYFVVEEASGIVACGGWAAEGDVAVLCWGMVRAEMHRAGIGTTLLRARMADAQAQGFKMFRTRTSQLTEAFYAKHGFRSVNRIANGFGSGVDQVEMILE